LGQSLVFTNRAGSAGGVSTAYVNAQAADGYELLFGAENPQVAKVMGTSEIDYDDFIPIILYCTTYATVSVSKDSPYNTLEELMDAILAEPGKMIMATTGAGGLPEVVASMFADVVGTEPTMVPFDGENECMTAIMGGNADYTITSLGSAASFYQSGDIKILSMLNDETVEGYEDVPIVLDSYPGFSKYLPWGPFYGVFVKNGTDQAIVDQLTAAFQEASQDQSFQDLIASKGCFPLGLSGDEAVEYLQKYRSTTSWLLYNSGVAETSPADFGIEQP
jgi:tripartite-type tricarboxylate transporter receptor subunit TctC